MIFEAALFVLRAAIVALVAVLASEAALLAAVWLGWVR